MKYLLLNINDCMKIMSVYIKSYLIVIVILFNDCTIMSSLKFIYYHKLYNFL